MKQQLVPFDFEGSQVRVVTDAQGEPWFVAADVLSTISLDRKALERLDDDEKGVNSIHTPGGAGCKGFPADAGGLAVAVAVVGRHYEAVSMAGETYARQSRM